MTLNKLLLVSLASSSLFLTACGGSGSSSSNRTAPTPTPTPTSTAATPTPTPTPGPTSDPSPTPTADPSPTAEPTPAGVTKVEGPLDPLQDEVVDGVVVGQVGSQLPAPLNGVVSCVATSLNHLIDGPDAILAGVEGLAAGADPFTAFNSSAAEAQAALERFAASLQASLVSLVDRGECSTTEDTAPAAGNPLAGTPLAPLGTVIEDLLTALDGEEGEDPNLTSLSNIIAPALVALATELSNNLPAELSGAPVLGGVFSTVEGALLDVAALLASAADYNDAATTADTENLINGVLSGLLLDTLPVADVDPAVAAQLQSGINTLTSTLGSGIGQVITPLFNDGLNGVASPLLDPVEGLLASILGSGNPLEGILAPLGGDGLNDPADAVLGLLLSTTAGTPLQNLVLAAGGAASNSSSPLALLGQLQSVLTTGGLDSILGDAVAQNDILGASVGTILDALLGDEGILGGLLGL